ncbi:MAG: phosphohydrolase [Clostridiaceae bacterium]|nr:phosphohydrolase [Clostridiaceae bacterium]
MENLHVWNGVPSLTESKLLLEDGGKLNPGPWVEHSMYAGKAAEIIAGNCPSLNSDIAYILGILHDIGRRFGVTSMRHSIDGYNFLIQKGYYMPAKICITHSFPYNNVNAVFGKWDCNDDEYKFVESFLSKIEFDDYDKLIQLCDALAFPEGFCLIEKRMIDVALRHGLNEYIVRKWKSTFKIQGYFEDIMGKSLYSILPGVIENTFNIRKKHS